MSDETMPGWAPPLVTAPSTPPGGAAEADRAVVAQIVGEAISRRIAALPDDTKALVTEMMEQIPLDQRLSVLEKQMSLIPTAPLRAGTTTQPGAPSFTAGVPPEPEKPKTAEEVRRESWNDAYRARGLMRMHTPETPAQKARRSEK